MNKVTKARIDAFVRQRPHDPLHNHRSWIMSREIHLYMRAGYHAINGKVYWFLDIANVEVAQKGKGLFTEVLEYCQAVTPYAGVFVENILNERLMEHMKKLQKKDPRWVQWFQSFAWLKNEATNEEAIQKSNGAVCNRATRERSQESAPTVGAVETGS
jgi:hypothetical protein